MNIKKKTKPRKAKFSAPAVVAENIGAEQVKQRLIESFSAISSIDPTLIWNDDGSAKPLSKIPGELRPFIQQVGREYYTDKKGKTQTRPKYKIVDRMRAMENLARSFGMFSDKIEHTVKEDLSKLTDAELDKRIDELGKRVGYERVKVSEINP